MKRWLAALVLLSSCAHAESTLVAGRPAHLDDRDRAELATAVERGTATVDALVNRPPGVTVEGRTYAEGIVVVQRDLLVRLGDALNAMKVAAASDLNMPAERQSLIAHAARMCDMVSAMTMPGAEAGTSINAATGTVDQLRTEIAAISMAVRGRRCN